MLMEKLLSFICRYWPGAQARLAEYKNFNESFTFITAYRQLIETVKRNGLC